MTQRLLRGSIALLAAALAVILVPVVASAATVSVSDARGDNWTRGYDITSVSYANRPERIASTVRLRSLRADTRAEFWVASRDGHSSTYGVVVARRKGKAMGQLWLFAVEGPGERIACEVRVSWSAKKDRIKVVIPTSCLDMNQKAVTMSTYISRKGATSWSDKSPTRRVRRG